MCDASGGLCQFHGPGTENSPQSQAMSLVPINAVYQTSGFETIQSLYPACSSNPSGTISKKVALPLPDASQNQTESNTAIEAIDVESEASEVSE